MDAVPCAGDQLWVEVRALVVEDLPGVEPIGAVDSAVSEVPLAKITVWYPACRSMPGKVGCRASIDAFSVRTPLIRL